MNYSLYIPLLWSLNLRFLTAIQYKASGLRVTSKLFKLSLQLHLMGFRGLERWSNSFQAIGGSRPQT